MSMNQQSWSSYAALAISVCTLLVSVWWLRETRSARILLTVDGHAHSSQNEDTSSFFDLTVEITNVGRVATTVTDVFWNISNKTGDQEVEAKETASNADVRYIIEASELPVVLEPNSSHAFSMQIPQEKVNTSTIGRPGATVIRRPKPFHRVSHDNTRSEIFGKERSFLEAQ